MAGHPPQHIIPRVQLTPEEQEVYSVREIPKACTVGANTDLCMECLKCVTMRVAHATGLNPISARPAFRKNLQTGCNSWYIIFGVNNEANEYPLGVNTDPNHLSEVRKKVRLSNIPLLHISFVEATFIRESEAMTVPNGNPDQVVNVWGVKFKQYCTVHH